MKKTALILICAGFLLFILIFTNQARADATTYYVDCNAATGGDGSLSTPWDAIADVNAAHFLPDDQILFARGCTFREQLTVPDSGNAGHPIIFGAYGDSGDPKPIISGADVITNWTAASGGDTGGIFIANAETNDTSQFSGVTVGGTSTFVAGVVANGSTHGYTATADGTNSALGYKTITPASTLYTRLYFRVKSGYSLNEGQDQVLLTVEDGGGTEQIIRVGIKKSSGVLTMFIADRIFYSFYSTGELVTTDAWHSLLLRYSATASGGAQAWLDGVSIGSNFSLDMSAHPADTVRVGINSNSDAKLGNGSIVYFDDIKADTASIGVVPNAPTNTYSASLSTVPRAVWQNSVQLTKETSIANIVAGSWYHDATANLLYANMSDGSNPSTKTVEAASRNNGIVITDKNYVTIDSLQAEKTNDTNKGAIWARTSTGTNTTNVTVQNSTVAFGMSGIMFQSVDNAVAYNNTVYGDLSTDLSGVYTEQLAAAHSMQSPSITYNTLHDLRFCTIQPIDGVTINTVNGTWGHNTCYNTSNYGMHFNLSTSPTIEYNLVHDGGTPTQDTHGIHWADTTGAIVRYNTVYNWKDPQNWSGGGYQADNNSDNSVIYGNIAYNNDGCGFSILNSSGVLVYNNMSYGNSQHQNFAEFCVMSPTGDGLNKASATLKNNIGFATKSGTYAVFVDANSEAHTQVIDNNLWYISSGNWWYHGGATSGINLAGGATGNSLSTWNAVSYVGTDLNADPQLNNPGGNDFTLKSISPAINTGISLGDTYKLGLNPNSVWPSAVNTLDQTLNGAGWEMGAYVFPALANQGTLTAVSTPSTVPYGTTATLSSSGGSGDGAVTFSVDSPTGCNITGGTTLNVSDPAGTCTVTAAKAADSNYNSVTSAGLTVTLTAGTQATLTVTGLPASAVYQQAGITAGTSGGSGDGAVTFSAGVSTACSINSSTGAVTITASSGTCLITATKAADSNYNSATSATVSIAVGTAPQTITVTTAAPGSATYNSTFPVAATASSGLTVAITTTGGCSISGGTVTMTSGTTACTVDYDQAGNGSYSAATQVVSITNAVLATQSTLTFTGQTVTSPSTFSALSTTGGSGTGAVTYAVTTAGTAGCSIVGTTLSYTTAGTCGVTATKAADSNYNSVSSSEATFTINAIADAVVVSSGGGGSSSGGHRQDISNLISVTTPPVISTLTTPCVPNTPTTSLNRNLSRGSEGSDVTILQNLLIKQNYLTADNVTGYFGIITETAIKSFQISNNIVSSGTPQTTGYGNVGATTRARINTLLGSTTTCTPTQTSTVISPNTSYNFLRNLSLNMTGEDVSELQKFLNTHNFIISITGPGSPGQETTLFGLLTYKSLQAFQDSVGLPNTGYFGPMTREIVNKK